MTHLSRYKGNPNSDCNMLSLPVNALSNPGVLYEDLETVGDWTASNGTAAANTTQFKTGAKSVKLTNDEGVDAYITKTVDWDLSGTWQHMTVWFYLHNPPASYDAGVEFYLANDADVTSYLRGSISLSNLASAGWNSYHLAKGDFGVVSSGTFASKIIRIKFMCYSAAIAAISFDSVYFGVAGVPGVILFFDDGYANQYSVCYQYMKNLGIRGNVAFDTTGTLISTAQLKEMSAAGWCVANHTNGSTLLTSLTEAQQEATILAAHDVLVGMGLYRGAHYLIYPGGVSNDDTITAMTNLGMLTGRGTRQTNALGCQMLALPFSSMWQMPSNGVTNSMSVATFTGLIDKAITGGYIVPFHFHNVGVGSEMTAANFKLCMDYIYTKYKAGLIYPYTIDDVYNASLSSWKVRKVNQ